MGLVHILARVLITALKEKWIRVNRCVTVDQEIWGLEEFVVTPNILILVTYQKSTFDDARVTLGNFIDLNWVVIEEVGDDEATVFVLWAVRVQSWGPAKNLRRVIDELEVVLLWLFWDETVDVSLWVFIITDSVVLWNGNVVPFLWCWGTNWA